MTSGSDREIRELRRLARVHGVQTSYFDIRHQRRTPPSETLLAVLRSMGEARETDCDLSILPVAATWTGPTGMCVAKRTPIPWKLPAGYHTLRVELGEVNCATTVVSAPMTKRCGGPAWPTLRGARRKW